MQRYFEILEKLNAEKKFDSHARDSWNGNKATNGSGGWNMIVGRGFTSSTNRLTYATICPN